MKENGKKQVSGRGAAERRLLRLAGNASAVDEAVRIVVADLLQDIPIAPTDLESLKDKLNILEVCGEDVPFSGELRRHGKRLKIIYSIHLTNDRRRFTIAHEMGHAILESTGRNCPRSGLEVERLCDMLAAEILMPRHSFLEKVGGALSIDRLFELKKTFQVSLLAVAFRCFDLKRASVFELEENSVKWGCGLVKEGSFRLTDDGLKLAIEEALQQPSGVMEVFFNDKGDTHIGELEWSQISQERTLFLLKRSGHKLTRVTPPYITGN